MLRERERERELEQKLEQKREREREREIERGEPERNGGNSDTVIEEDRLIGRFRNRLTD